MDEMRRLGRFVEEELEKIEKRFEKKKREKIELYEVLIEKRGGEKEELQEVLIEKREKEKNELHEALKRSLEIEDAEEYRRYVIATIEKAKKETDEEFLDLYREELYDLFLCKSFHEKFIRKEEWRWVAKKRRRCGDTEREEGKELFGMALSGGGIRSATFNLGLLQALQRYDVFKSVDILSTVSGGGYIGASQTWLHYMDPHRPYPFGTRRRDHDELGGKILDWLRDHGKYLTPGDGLGLSAFVAAFLGSVLLNLAILAPFFLFGVFVLYVTAPLNLFGWGGAVCLAVYLSMVAYTSVFSVIGRKRSFLHQRKSRQWAGKVLALSALLGLAWSVPWVHHYLTTHMDEWMGSLSLTSVAAGAASFATSYLRIRKRESMPTVFSTISMSGGILLVLYGLVLWLYRLVEIDAPGREVFAPLVVALLSAGLIVLLAKSMSNRKSAFSIALGIWILSVAWYLRSIFHTSYSPGGVELFFFLSFPLSALLAAFAGINYVGMHRYYRNRLMEAFFPWQVMGVSAEWADRFELKSMKPLETPYHIVNTNVNMVGSARTKQRERGGDNFILSPLFCGSCITGYRETDKFAGGEMNLATAMAISGAAVDPNTYATRSKPVSFVMSLFNARLGYWSENPRKLEDAKRLGGSYYIYIFKELFGKGLNEKERYIHLADGGHFENLGVYELIRRRCRFILVSDAGRDAGYTFGDLAKLIEMVRVDFGAKITLDTRPLRPEGEEKISKSAFVHGTVRYEDGSEGNLLYVKTTMIGGLPEDIYSYRRTNPAFPDESTGDQFFDEAQFEAYRELGYQVGKRLCGGEKVADFRALFHRKES
ncbi:hypothetical protein [Hydrogenimonas sp.]